MGSFSCVNLLQGHFASPAGKSACRLLYEHCPVQEGPLHHLLSRLCVHGAWPHIVVFNTLVPWQAILNCDSDSFKAIGFTMDRDCRC